MYTSFMRMIANDTSMTEPQYAMALTDYTICSVNSRDRVDADWIGKRQGRRVLDGG